MNLIVYLYQNSRHSRCIFSEQQDFERNVFFGAEGLNSGFKLFSKPGCKQMCCHPGFVFPFINVGRVDAVQFLMALEFSEW